MMTGYDCFDCEFLQIPILGVCNDCKDAACAGKHRSSYWDKDLWDEDISLSSGRPEQYGEKVGR